MKKIVSVSKIIIGALTSKPYAFIHRPWELKVMETFDPTSDYFIPINVTISNNEIKRVLPINEEFFGYNWISNKTRFFFEFVSPKSEFSSSSNSRYFRKEEGIVVSEKFNNFNNSTINFRSLNFFHLLNKISVKVSSVYNSVKIDFSRKNLYFDLYSANNFEQFRTFFAESQFTLLDAFSGYVKHDSGNASGLVSNGFSPGRQVKVKGYKRIFLIGFDPYFVDPYLNFEINSEMANNSISVYTFFSKFSAFSNLSKNFLPSLENLVAFFLGKHNRSPDVMDKSTLIILDYVFISSLPQNIQVVFFKFSNIFWPNVRLVNTNLNFQLLTEPRNFRDKSNFKRFWSPQFQINCPISKKFVNFISTYSSDYAYIFKPSNLEFSLNFTGEKSVNKVFPNYFNSSNLYIFPISSVSGFTGLYKNLKFKEPKLFSLAITSNLKGPKPLGVFFNVFLSRIKSSFDSFHLWIYHTITFYILIFSIALIKFSSFNFFVNKFGFNYDNTSCAIYKKLTFTNSSSSEIFSYCINSNFNYDWCSDRGHNLFRGYPGEYYYPCRVQSDSFKYFKHYYAQSPIMFINDFQVDNSKVLSLDRAFRIRKFVNFRRKILFIENIIICYINLYSLTKSLQKVENKFLLVKKLMRGVTMIFFGSANYEIGIYLFISILSLFIPLLISVAFLTLVERKILGSIQRRVGPNQVGFLGLLQPISDAAKLIFKETVVPITSNRALYFIAPVLSFILSLVIWAPIPVGKYGALANIDLGLLYIFGISSLGVYSIVLAGWSSGSRYAFLGSLRSTAQMISYEVSFGLILISVLLCAGSLNLSDIVNFQDSYIWFCVPLFPLSIVFFISTLAETNRPPFDLPEAEAELVAGYNVEYSSIGFALFFIAEYANIIMMSTLNVIFFWGGWGAPFAFLSFIPGSIFFAVKIMVFVFLFIWVRAVLPRYRYDQLMFLGWKVFLPISLSYIFIISFIMIILYEFKVFSYD